ncbi:hypothetical protein [Pseudomonas putida]|jgi:hypothetical protein|uniref:hypothetical protein n=1 Tax=Pseudomonas putida TaxID=303 RepID=UPI00384CC35F
MKQRNPIDARAAIRAKLDNDHARAKDLPRLVTGTIMIIVDEGYVTTCVMTPDVPEALGDIERKQNTDDEQNAGT